MDNLFKDEILKDLITYTNTESEKQFNKSLRRYDLITTLKAISSMLINPDLKVYTPRLETVLYHALCNCKFNSKTKPTRQTFIAWINQAMINNAALLEDPAEDVFISNLRTPRGNFLLLTGQWEGTLLALETIFETMDTSPPLVKNILIPCYELLKLSHSVLTHLGLRRWHSSEACTPQKHMPIPDNLWQSSYIQNISITDESLSKFCVDKQKLLTFCQDEESRKQLKEKQINTSNFYSKPLFLDKNGNLLLAMPENIGFAIKKYVLEKISSCGLAEAFNSNIFHHVLNKSIRSIEISDENHEISRVNLEIHDTNRNFVNYCIKISRTNFIHFCFINDDHSQYNNEDKLSNINLELRSKEINETTRKIQEYIKTKYSVSNFLSMYVLSPLGFGTILPVETKLFFEVSYPRQSRGHERQ